MESLIKAVYETLSTDPTLVQLVPVEQIRRGWNEPVLYPTVRFAMEGVEPSGDDMDNKAIIMESILINILTDGDLEIEPIADAVISAMKAKSLTRDNLLIHSCDFTSDNGGTFFDPLRKKHRKDLSFIVIYSSISD